MTRAENVTRARTLRADGRLLREIAAEMGIAVSTVGDLLHDPTGEKARERKRRYEHPCEGCGRTVNPNGLERGTGLCRACVDDRKTARSRRWIVESMREWAELFGAPPSAYDWNPASVRWRGWAGSQWRVERYESTGRRWPSTTLVIDRFGSWTHGLRAAGFEPLTPCEYWRGYAGRALVEEIHA